MDISVVIPVFNEEENLPELYSRLVTELDKLGKTWEVILTDDGSKDGSPQLLQELAEKDERIKIILFRRNFGQTAAMEAGFRHASGDVVIPMDADLQNDPKDIGKLLDVIDEGYDVAKGWRKNRKDAFISRTLPSRIANGLISKVTGVALHDYGCTLTAYRKEIIREIRLYGEMHRFIPAYAVWAGGKIKEIEVDHHPRTKGQTKYGISRTFRVILDLMTVRFLVAYSTKPNYLFGKWGLLAIAAAMLSFFWSLTKRIVWEEPVFTDPFFYATIFLGLAGLQILLIGLLAELNMRTYFESQDRTAYVIKELCNLEPPAPRER
jgi:glycosyltransferase involved in cell wall biosynthesis